MTREEIRDYAAREWGLDNEYTEEMFRMYERGDNIQEMNDFIDVAEFLMYDTDDNWDE